jgi:AAA+ superfamily predicted ATPase
MLAEQLGFDVFERDFIGLLIRHRTYGLFSHFVYELTQEHLSAMEICSLFLTISEEALSEKLRPAGRLLSSGAVQLAWRGGGQDLDDHFQIIDCVRNGVRRSQGDWSDLLATIIGKPARAELTWNDFSHLGTLRNRMSIFLRKVSAERIPGVNILIWGAPGTGKTEFCKTLASHLGLTLFSIGEKDEGGNEPSRRERLDYYCLAQSLLNCRPDTLLMFDEMDDLFEGQALARFLGGKTTSVSKVFLNRLLENNPMPTLWLINDVSILDEAFIRRMALAVEIKVPPPSSRETIWTRVLNKHALALPVEEMRRLAELNIPPAIIDSAARFTQRVGGSSEDFRFAAQGIVQAMRGGSSMAREERGEAFLPELTCADIDLRGLTECLCAASQRDFSLCLFGPPGTGKSVYLRHVAEQMKMPLLLKRASDVLDMYVGGSERKIARAFQEAIDREAFLVFDEADSLLSDRRQAQHSREISQVNEMLTWMERHPLPFACTTNLRERIDQASLRRFTFKCCFDYLRPEHVAPAFRNFFGLEMPSTIAVPINLTPGDFAVVRKKAGILGETKNPRKLLELLVEEGEKKRERQGVPIGFGVR